MTGERVGQPRGHSVMESVVNVMAGFVVALFTQIVVFPWFGIHIEITQNLGISAIFTVISLARSFLLRRAFNAWHLRGS